MKSLSEFLEEISEIIDDSIKKLVCKIELRKMKRQFVEHKNVEKIVDGYFHYFEYKIKTDDFEINIDGEILVNAIDYWQDVNEWFVAGSYNRDGSLVQMNASRLSSTEMVEMVKVLKEELFS
jgi:hypothetical protein